MVSLLAYAAYGQWPPFDRVQAGELEQRRHVSIVYADQNLKSPASMFGHTFLVFHDEWPPEVDAPVVEYLGDSASFMGELRAVLLSIPGGFRLSRFLFMRRQYDLEDRDLFVYRLMLSPTEKSRLVEGVKASLRTSSKYNFLRDNCSFHVVELVLNAFDEPPQYGVLPFVLPANTVRLLEQSGRVLESVSVPSSLRRLEIGYGRLSPSERNEFHQVAAGMGDASIPHPCVKSALREFVAYQVPREASAERRNALFEAAAASASPVESLSCRSEALLRDPARRRASAIGLGHRTTNRGIATATITPAVRSFENAENDALRNSSLEIGRFGLFYRPGWAGLYQMRLIYLDAEQPDSRFGSGFTRYLDVSFEKAANTDWSLHDEYRIHFGGGRTFERGPVAASAVVFLGPRYVVSASNGTFLGDIGVKVVIHLWIGSHTRAKSEFKWTPFAPVNDRGLWSNMLATSIGPLTLLAGVESPGGRPSNAHPIVGMAYTF